MAEKAACEAKTGCFRTRCPWLQTTETGKDEARGIANHRMISARGRLDEALESGRAMPHDRLADKLWRHPAFPEPRARAVGSQQPIAGAGRAFLFCHGETP